MSQSSPPLDFIPSSPGTSSKPSRYTYRHLQLLRQNSPISPLRVIAHVDLDAFYAQCEMVRLGIPRDTPLAVQQWDSLIAINYAARPFGITRMLSAIEAKKKCPDLVLQHVATFREGEGGRWAYRDDASKNIQSDKVSLDPYRAQSRNILRTIKEELTKLRGELIGLAGGALSELLAARMEKASIDEVFIDLSSLVYATLYQRYPELRKVPTADDKTTPLPCPPTTALDWSSDDGLVDLDENEAEEDDPDWDDIAMLIGAELIRSVRATVWEKLSYTCSAGIARNKMMSKLGSACNKPDKQTIVRNRAIQKFLDGFKFTKIRMLGGKLGDQISSEFGTEQVNDLLKVSLDQFKAKLDDDTAVWLYNIIRGIDNSEVNTRMQIKSMLSAKSFRPSINSAEQAEKWLRIFAADLYSRLVEDGLLEKRRRPRTITLHYRTGGQMHSKQLSIPGGKMIEETILFSLARDLLKQVMAEGRAWPTANLSLSVGGFEDGPTNNKAIDSFFTPGRISTSESILAENVAESRGENQPAKKLKIASDGIGRFFKHVSQVDSELEDKETSTDTSPPPEVSSLQFSEAYEGNDMPSAADGNLDNVEHFGLYVCPRCNQEIVKNHRDEHDDWHFAKELEAQEVQADRTSQGIAQQSSRRVTTERKIPGPGRPRSSKTEKGQKRLFFG
ncbi:putative sister chromatid cohesion protein [Talaromyces proteolyticus]|uniref:DNA polymerase eta n=1 Tax=Talaromyces proteolyticus TaxID=1131652 RepID=A0AAD4Q3G6_9EURO|nr:putative sister chromatid cohesion protein [Talaromyces proteolyticus]KAH8701753.1 putative sister chromatid cohesion protein [Talaromyces proteolyticus]